MPPLDTWSDESLAAEARTGSSACFEELVRRYQTRLLRFVRRTLNQADAEDLLQDAFVQAYVNLKKYDARWSFKTWLFVIAQRLTIDKLRRRRVTKELPDDAHGESADPALVTADREWSGRLWGIARSVLDEEPFRAVWLHYVEEMPTRDIARVLGRSWVWVKTSLHRSRKKLMPHLAGMTEPMIKTGEPCRTP